MKPLNLDELRDELAFECEPYEWHEAVEDLIESFKACIEEVLTEKKVCEQVDVKPQQYSLGDHLIKYEVACDGKKLTVDVALKVSGEVVRVEEE